MLLQSSYNYRERGMHTIVFAPAVDTRFGVGVVKSRIGIEAPAVSFSPGENLLARVSAEHAARPLDCVLVDEAQFLTRDQVQELSDVADRLSIPVLCYGLRTDFKGDLFEGSQWLLAWADKIVEIKAVCHCGRKATMVLRLSPTGQVVKEGEQVEIGGNERYVSVCRKHFKDNAVG